MKITAERINDRRTTKRISNYKPTVIFIKWRPLQEEWTTTKPTDILIRWRPQQEDCTTAEQLKKFQNVKQRKCLSDEDHDAASATCFTRKRINSTSFLSRHVASVIFLSFPYELAVFYCPFVRCQRFCPYVTAVSAHIETRNSFRRKKTTLDCDPNRKQDIRQYLVDIWEVV